MVAVIRVMGTPEERLRGEFPLRYGNCFLMVKIDCVEYLRKETSLLVRSSFQPAASGQCRIAQQ